MVRHHLNCENTRFGNCSASQGCIWSELNLHTSQLLSETDNLWEVETLMTITVSCGPCFWRWICSTYLQGTLSSSEPFHCLIRYHCWHESKTQVLSWHHCIGAFMKPRHRWFHVSSDTCDVFMTPLHCPYRFSKKWLWCMDSPLELLNVSLLTWHMVEAIKTKNPLNPRVSYSFGSKSTLVNSIQCTIRTTHSNPSKPF